MSEIEGSGYGSTHNWKLVFVCRAQIKNYQCLACGKAFQHYYAKTPDVFKALRMANVGECRNVGGLI